MDRHPGTTTPDVPAERTTGPNPLWAINGGLAVFAICVAFIMIATA